MFITRSCVCVYVWVGVWNRIGPLSHNPSFILICPLPARCTPYLVYSQDMTNMNQDSDDSDTDNDSDSDCELPEYVLIAIVKRRRLNKAAASAKLRSTCVGCVWVFYLSCIEQSWCINTRVSRFH